VAGLITRLRATRSYTTLWDVTLSLSVASSASANMEPNTWRKYVTVRTKLIRDVNSFMATYRSCATQKGFLTIAWGQCVEPALYPKYVVPMANIDKLLIAVLAAPTRDECYDTVHKYTVLNQRARMSAIRVIRDTWQFKRPMARRQANAQTFTIDRNKATNMRLRIDEVCAP
jgi:hypothetical protein